MELSTERPVIELPVVSSNERPEGLVEVKVENVSNPDTAEFWIDVFVADKTVLKYIEVGRWTLFPVIAPGRYTIDLNSYSELITNWDNVIIQLRLASGDINSPIRLDVASPRLL